MASAARAYLITLHLSIEPPRALRPRRSNRFICKVHFDAVLECPNPALLIAYTIFIIVCTFIHRLKTIRIYYCLLIHFEGSPQHNFIGLAVGKFRKVFTLRARITFDKHRNEFLQTHRRTFICLGHTLGFTSTSHSAHRRIGTHLYWQRILYYLFVGGCRICCGSFDFFQFGNNAEGVELGAIGFVVTLGPINRASVFVSRRRACRLVKSGTYLRGTFPPGSTDFI